MLIPISDGNAAPSQRPRALRPLLAGLALCLAGGATALELAPQPHQGRAAHIAAELLGRYHYRAVALNDTLSERIFDRYLKALDGERMYFLQADIDSLAPLRTRLDDAILNEDLQAPFALFNLYGQRVAERFAYARSLLKAGFDFAADEDFRFVREKSPWARSEAELHDLWRQRVKNDWLRLKLAGKDDRTIAETLDRRYEHSLRRMERVKSEDAFQVFMNAYAQTLDPHTSYLGPSASENFDISLRLSLVGIGAVLQERDDYTTIRELVPGGPAARSGQLRVGDRILAVGQDEGAMTDVIGWRLDDTVALIRGGVDTVVRLDILPADAGPEGKPRQVSLVRQTIRLEDQAAKRTILTTGPGRNGRRIGVITLPAFYEDFAAHRAGEKDFRSATRDVTRLIGDLKAAKVDGIVIDLRGNGGGSLGEAVALTGLFIDRGPVVQQRNAEGKVSAEQDPNPGVVWNGPLGVLIDGGSASASEIFAAAIQDYGRGVILGQPSFGKGTVQSLVDLDRIARNTGAKYGEVKLTIAQFFRVNGGTTQLRGVSPDIAFPETGSGELQGEASFDNALPWTKIAQADYVAAGRQDGILPRLRARHVARLRTDADFQSLQADLAEIERLRKRETISLNEAVRRQERDALETRLAKRKEGAAQADDGLQADERPLAAELANEKQRKNSKDIVLAEAARIVGDAAELGRRGSFAGAGSRPDRRPEANAQHKLPTVSSQEIAR